MRSDTAPTCRSSCSYHSHLCSISTFGCSCSSFFHNQSTCLFHHTVYVKRKDYLSIVSMLQVQAGKEYSCNLMTSLHKFLSQWSHLYEVASTTHGVHKQHMVAACHTNTEQWEHSCYSTQSHAAAELLISMICCLELFVQILSCIYCDTFAQFYL